MSLSTSRSIAIRISKQYTKDHNVIVIKISGRWRVPGDVHIGSAEGVSVSCFDFPCRSPFHHRSVTFTTVLQSRTMSYGLTDFYLFTSSRHQPLAICMTSTLLLPESPVRISAKKRPPPYRFLPCHCSHLSQFLRIYRY